METELEPQKMQMLKEMADTNVRISDAKNLLFKLQEDETVYLEAREKKAMVKINKVFEDSKDLLDKTYKNYEEIHQFCQKVNEYADFLSETHTKFQKILEVFEKKNELWEKNVKNTNEEIAKQRKIIEQDSKAIKIREERIDEENEKIKKEREHLESQQVALSVAFKVEKDLWNKMNKI